MVEPAGTAGGGTDSGQTDGARTGRDGDAGAGLTAGAGAEPDSGVAPDSDAGTMSSAGVERDGAEDQLNGMWARMPWLVRWVVLGAACLLVVVFGLYVMSRIVVLLAPLAIALAATLFLSALLDPLACRLRSWRLPPTLAALISLLVLLGFLVGAVALTWSLTASQFGDLSKQLGEGVTRLRDYLTTALPVSNEQLDSWAKEATEGFRRSSPDPVARARTAAEVVGSFLLVLVLLFFLLKDGRPMWRWLLRRVRVTSRPVVAEAGRNGWRTLTAYTRGTMAIAAIDAIGIGFFLVVLRVPLAVPLTLITFIGAFVPIIGATVAGSVAVLVALAAKGPTTALIVLAAVIAVQQVEGNLLEPLIMKRQVQLHPVVVLVAVTAGTLIGGVAGAFVAVPITAVVYRVVQTVAEHRRAAEARTLPGPPPA